MKYRYLRPAVEYLTQQLNHWVFFPLFVTIQGLTASFTGVSRPDVLLFALCGLFPPAFFLLREKAGRLWLCLLLHLPIWAAAFLLPASDPVERGMAIGLGAGYLLFSLRLRFREAQDSVQPIPPAAALGVAFGASLLERYQGPKDWDIYYAAGLVWVFALFFLVSYLRHYLAFVEMNEKSGGCLPGKDMFRSGMGLVTGYILLGSLFLLLGSRPGWLSFLWERLKGWLLAALRFLFSLLPEESRREGPAPIQTRPPFQSADMGTLKAEQPFFLWQALEYVIAAAVLSALLFGAGKGLFSLARFLKERFQNRRGELSEAAGEENTDVREKCGPVSLKTGQKKGKPYLFLSPQERVRRLYRKKAAASSFALTGQRPGPALSLLTARECGEKLKLPQMAQLYEQARYSGREITKEQLGRMRALCKKERGNPFRKENV